MLRKCLRSFGPALAGIAHLFRTQNNARIQLLAAVAVLVAGLLFEITAGEWIAVVLCIALVLALEGINSALESLADAVHPEPHPLVGRAKDIAAGAVLLCALASVAVAAIIFGPRIAALFAE